MADAIYGAKIVYRRYENSNIFNRCTTRSRISQFFVYLWHSLLYFKPFSSAQIKCAIRFRLFLGHLSFLLEILLSSGLQYLENGISRGNWNCFCRYSILHAFVLKRTDINCKNTTNEFEKLLKMISRGLPKFWIEGSSKWEGFLFR